MMATLGEEADSAVVSAASAEGGAERGAPAEGGSGALALGCEASAAGGGGVVGGRGRERTGDRPPASPVAPTGGAARSGPEGTSEPSRASGHDAAGVGLTGGVEETPAAAGEGAFELVRAKLEKAGVPPKEGAQRADGSIVPTTTAERVPRSGSGSWLP